MRRAGQSGFVPIALALSVCSGLAQTAFAQTPGGPNSIVGGTSSAIPDDLSLLVGKRVIVGRMALCTPKTYSVNLSYSGKTAKVVSFSRNTTVDGVKRQLRSLPPATQSLMENQMKGGLVLFEFDDGTRLDNCVDIGWNELSAQIELAPGESVLVSAPAQNAPPSSPPPPSSGSNNVVQTCPITIVSLKSGISFAHILLDQLTTSEFEQQLDQAAHNGQGKHYLDIKVHNDSGKSVSAFEFGSVYSNKMGDEGASTNSISQNRRSIAAGVYLTVWAMDRDTLEQSGIGQVEVFVSRVKFDDGTFWQDDGTRSCSRTTIVQ